MFSKGYSYFIYHRCHDLKYYSQSYLHPCANIYSNLLGSLCSIQIEMYNWHIDGIYVKIIL